MDVQTSTNTNGKITTVQKWIPSAVWNPVRGGLASDSGFRADTSRSEDPNDLWAQMSVYGSLSLNNSARLEEKTERGESLALDCLISFIRICLECNILMRFRTTGGQRGGGGSTRGRKAAGVERYHKSPPNVLPRVLLLTHN